MNYEEKRIYAATKNFEELATKYFNERYGSKCVRVYLSECGVVNGLPTGVVKAWIYSQDCNCEVEFLFKDNYSPYKVEQVNVYVRQPNNIAFATVGEWVRGIEALNESKYKKFTKRRDGIAVTVYKSRDCHIDIEGNIIEM